MTKRLLSPAEQFGDAAGQSPAQDQPFAVDQAALVAAYPNVGTDNEAWTELVDVYESTRTKDVNREMKRKLEHANDMYAAGSRFIFAGAHVIAQNEDPKIGRRAGEAVLAQLPASLRRPPDRPGDKEKDRESFSFHTHWEQRAIPLAEPVRRLHIVSGLVAAEIDATDPGDLDANYLLLKAMATDPSPKRFETKYNASSGWSPNHAMVALAGIARSTVHRLLTAQLLSGVFDGRIAEDILRFVDADRVLDPNFAKIRQLGRFGIAFAGKEPKTKAEFYKRMAGTFSEWPTPERQVVLDSRHTIRDAIESNVTRAESWLRYFSFVSNTDPLKVFDGSIDDLLLEALKRESLSGADRAQMIQATHQRGLHKRKHVSSRTRRDERKKASGGDDPEDNAAPAEEEDRTPPTMVTLNLNDHTSAEGVQGLIDDFIARASQGNKAHIRADLERMTRYLLRTDLPLGSRRGVKPLENISVTFGPDGQARRLHELKPSDAPDLSTSTNLVNGSRMYFIKLPGNVIGVVGIEQRSKQDAFLLRLRNRAKRSQGSKDQDIEVND